MGYHSELSKTVLTGNDFTKHHLQAKTNYESGNGKEGSNG
jgi:hypothetical protein